jgi:hypothetical protein
MIMNTVFMDFLPLLIGLITEMIEISELYRTHGGTVIPEDTSVVNSHRLALFVTLTGLAGLRVRYSIRLNGKGREMISITRGTLNRT